MRFLYGEYMKQTMEVTNENMETIIGILLPFFGTTAGAASIFLLKDEVKPGVQKALLGFASGVMVAASVWSLLIPAMNMSEHMGKLSFIPAAAGFMLGILFLLAMDRLVPHLHMGCDEAEGPRCKLKRSTMMVLAVTLHNVPEGLSLGAVLAAMMTEESGLGMAAALALSIGIAIQNFPEGAIISLPLKTEGKSRGKAFLYGALSGAVEPVAAGITLLLASYVTPILPYLLAFSAGAMIYVVVEELIPEASEGEHSNVGTIGFAVGFVLMMILDVALG